MEGEDSDEEEELDDNNDDADQEIIFWTQNLAVKFPNLPHA